MSNAEKYHFADFTHANYRRLIALAKTAYSFRTYEDFEPDGRFVLWRHDVDFSMHAALALAKIENEEQVRATYFVHFHNEFYNLLERAVGEKLREIIALGHHVGLHFDTHHSDIESESSLVRHLNREKENLEDLVGRPVAVFSFHRPSTFTQRCLNKQYSGMLNVYSEYFRRHVSYCSDSNGYWRHRRLEDVLAARSEVRLQVLTHPAWWQESVMSPHERIERCIIGRADATRRTYGEILQSSGRPDIDW